MKKILHLVALVAVLAGGAVSLGLMFNAGRNQSSIFLIVAFTSWVSLPFIVLLVADIISKRWPAFQTTLYYLMLFITVFSLICYAEILNIPGTKPAFKFLIVPLVSLLLIGIVIYIARSRPRSAPRT